MSLLPIVWKLGSFYFYEKLPTYPSPKLTLTRTSHLGQNIGLGEGWVVSFAETYNNAKLEGMSPTLTQQLWGYLHRGYYTVAQRSEILFSSGKQYFTNERSEWVKYCFCHLKIKFISSSHRVMFFLLYRQKDIDKVIEGNDRNYITDKLMCEIMENKPLGSQM